LRQTVPNTSSGDRKSPVTDGRQLSMADNEYHIVWNILVNMIIVTMGDGLMVASVNMVPANMLSDTMVIPVVHLSKTVLGIRVPGCQKSQMMDLPGLAQDAL